ncbi:MAG: strictosidine synthase family protein, partial [Leptospiraceae bacterium]|nr:strictosidine synthase family protein [Leptospiraceae bacterium]
KEKLLILYISIFAVLFIALILYPSPVDPENYIPSPPIEVKQFEKNELLKKAEIISDGEIDGPESIAVGEDGLLYTGTSDGWIMKIYPDGTVEKFVNTEGRPLGLKFYPESTDLIVCDSYKGLLRVDENGKMEVLTDSSNGVKFRFTDDLDITSEGIIYFTDASDKFYQKEYLYDLLEAKPHGRLLKYDPSTKETTTILKDLYFANGVALSSDESFLLVNETYRYRIRRYWLEGEKKGETDIFIDNLPGFPDNITQNGNGIFYVALFTVRNPALNFLHSMPSLSRQVAKLPKFLWPRPKPYAFIFALDEEGEVINSFQDSNGSHIKHLTSAIENEGYLYLGSLHEKRIGKYKLEE